MDTDAIRASQTVWQGDFYRVYALFWGGFKVEQRAPDDGWIYVDRFVTQDEAMRCVTLLESREIVREALRAKEAG